MMLDILETVNHWIETEQTVALATVVETWGSAPRQAGAKMAVTSDGAMIGSVSGGCVEAAVVQEMLDSLEDGKPRLLDFGVSDDSAWEVGLACGGQITVFVEPLQRNYWTHVSEDVKVDRRLVTATILSGEQAGAKILLNEDYVVFPTFDAVPLWVTDLQAAVAACQVTKRRAVGDLDVLVEVYQPRPRLILIGGAQVAMALSKLALLLGFRVIVIDPRQAFATPERFPDVELISHQYPDKALASVGLNEHAYVAVLTHDPKIDDPALVAALPSNAAYIGVLSSRRTHEKRVERLTKAGVDPTMLARIRTPIGLAIDAKTPEEIALAILAEIVSVKNGKNLE